MSEREDNIFSAEEFEETEKLDNDFIPADAQPVCPNCFEPCDRLQYYCDNCNSNEVINPVACYMPFVRIRFNVGMLGKIWHRILYDRQISVFIKLLFLLIIIFALLIWPT